MMIKLKNCCKKIPIEISFQSYKLIFVFIFPAFGVAHNRFRDEYLIADKHEFFNIFLYYLSYLFSLIPIVISLILNRTKNEKEESENDQEQIQEKDTNIIVEESNYRSVSIIDEENRRTQRKLMIINILILIFLCGVSLAYNHFNFESYIDKKTIGVAYKIPEFFLLSYFILKYKYHKHHYITFGINTVTLLTKYFLTVILANSESYIGYHIGLYFLYSITYCLFLVLGKYYMDKYNNSPYFVMLIIGSVIGLILIIISIIKYFTISESQIFQGFYDNIINRDSKKYIFLFLADIISQFIYNLGLWITVYYFTPCHTIISENMMEILYYIYDYKVNQEHWIEKKFHWNFWLLPLVLLLNLLCSLIFNEIIILNFCGLDFYTKIRIQERVRKESDLMIDTIDKTTENDSKENSFSSENNPNNTM